MVVSNILIKKTEQFYDETLVGMCPTLMRGRHDGSFFFDVQIRYTRAMGRVLDLVLNYRTKGWVRNAPNGLGKGEVILPGY